MSILSFTNVFAGTPEQEFWKWFEKNEKSLFSFEADQENIFDKLSEQMNKVNPDLTFEFGPVDANGKREFVISAGGIKSAFPSVESLYKSAPKLSRWHFIKYRPRRSPLNDIEYGGKTIKAANVQYKLYKDGDKLGIILFFADYSEKEKDVFGNIGYLLLDEALGEYDMETRVGFIEFHGHESKQYSNAKSLATLAENFDDYFKNNTK